MFKEVEFGMDIWREVQGLIKKHYDEVSIYGELNPDVYYYLRSETKTFLAYDKGKIIGYALYLVSSHPHYTDMICASQDVLFVDPEYRKGTLGIRFLKYQEECLKDYGVNRIFQSTKLARDLSKLYGFLGYEQTDIIYSKEL